MPFPKYRQQNGLQFACMFQQSPAKKSATMKMQKCSTANIQTFCLKHIVSDVTHLLGFQT